MPRPKDSDSHYTRNRQVDATALSDHHSVGKENLFVRLLHCHVAQRACVTYPAVSSASRHFEHDLRDVSGLMRGFPFLLRIKAY